MTLPSLMFLIPVFFFGVGTILAVQDALGFSDDVREFLNFVLLGLAMLVDDRYGPRAAERERER
jgi:positive regulator of sigma E activity